jgi:hypothetical protein
MTYSGHGWVVFADRNGYSGSAPSAFRIHRQQLQLFEQSHINPSRIWRYENMPEELSKLCSLVTADPGGGPWRQVVDWLLQNEDLVPPEFWRLFTEVVDSDTQFCQAGWS